jgi:catechol 2,3-dioxygenase-like lactoylglutathione lyase family enzyme
MIISPIRGEFGRKGDKIDKEVPSPAYPRSPTSAVTARISRIILFVQDVPAVAAFYERHFGLKPIASAEDGWLELVAGGCNLALHRAPKTSCERGRSPARIVFAVADVHAARQSFAKDGLKFGKVHEVSDFAFANARDPEGNPIQISSRGIAK